MSNLSAFLHPVMPTEQEIMISDRFLGEDGKPVPFKIKPLRQEEVDALKKKCTISVKARNGQTKTIDTEKLTRMIIVAGTVEPSFEDADLCAAYGVLDPLMVPGKMLLAGEYNRLGDAIAALSGLDDKAAETEEEEAKN